MWATTFSNVSHAILILCTLFNNTQGIPTVLRNGRAVPAEVFESLEELSRIVDISYCVGSTGIQKPFQCLGRCSDFNGFELITTWNTGPLLSDSCGYIALSHDPHEKRVLVVFRGTYSIANTIADLSTTHAEYLPFPANASDSACEQVTPESGPSTTQLTSIDRRQIPEQDVCENCTVHSGFLRSWENTRCTILPHVEKALRDHPKYKLVVVGHSLGGAVAAIAGLEFLARGYDPHVTTFGEPRIGNHELNKFIDRKFSLNASTISDSTFRRVTHIDDPVPLLPLEEWGFEMHAGEIFVSRAELPVRREDLLACQGDADPSCIANGGDSAPAQMILGQDFSDFVKLPSRYKLWQLFFAHRDYFHRLGLCVPKSDPWDWHLGKEVHDQEL